MFPVRSGSGWLWNLVEAVSFWPMDDANAPGVQIDGEQLRARRKLSGDNLVVFAPKCGITVQYLSQIERGDRKACSPRVFAAICDALNIPTTARQSLVRPETTAVQR